MYIPMNENETRHFKLPAPLDVELVVKPFTGANEVFYLDNIALVESSTTAQEKFTHGREIFNFFVKGFIHPEKNNLIEFTEDKKASSYFGVEFIAEFLHNIRTINTLTIEEKKT